MIGRFLATIFAGLLLAGFVHVVTILLIPQVAPRDAVSRAHAARPMLAMSPIPADASVLPDLDPAFAHAICPFDSRLGPIEITGTMPADIWSFAVVSKIEGIVASATRAAAVDNRIDLVVARSADVERIRLARASEGSMTTYAETRPDLAFVLIRAFVDTSVDRAAITATLAALRCERIEE